MKHPPYLRLFAATLLVSSTLLAQPTRPTTSATTTQPASEDLVAVVEQVEGQVQIREAGSTTWRKAVVGMQLRPGSQIRTGVRSSIRCGIPPDQTFVLDRLGTIELTDAIRRGNFVKTDLTMKYGRAQYEVQKAGLDHDGQIRSPGATLAVRGTNVELDDSPPFKPRATSYTGRALFSADRRESYLGNTAGIKAAMDTGSSSAAQAALLSSVIDPQFGISRTPADERLIAQQTSLGAVARFDKLTNILTLSGGAGPTRQESNLLTELPGRLNFVARWTGNADINLSVTVYKGSPSALLANPARDADEFIYPGYRLDQSRSGGRTDFDHRGGAKGGTEIVYWKNPLPTATYAVVVDRISGDTTPVTLNVFKDGVKLPMYTFYLDPNGPAVSPTLTPGAFDFDPSFTYRDGKSTTYTYTLDSSGTGRFGTAIVYDPISETPIDALPDLNNNAPADIADNSTFLAARKAIPRQNSVLAAKPAILSNSGPSQTFPQIRSVGNPRRANSPTPAPK